MGRLFSALLIAIALLLQGNTALACRIIDSRPIEPMPANTQPKPMETKSHQAEIAIDGQAASVRIEAVFHNPNNARMEGTYFLPLPTDVAVKGFSMTINGKDTKGELLDATKAKQIYEDIVRRMKDPGLLEFVGMQMIKVRVFPIEPNSDVAIRLEYNHLVPRDNGFCRLSYPLASAKPDDSNPIGQVALRVNLSSKIALKNIYSPTHKIDVTRKDDHHAVAGFEAKGLMPESDFTLYWSEAEQDVGANVITHKPTGEDGYFLLLLSPKIAAEEKPSPKDVVFVCDVSGSMQINDKISQAKRALGFCLSKLNPGDNFDIIAFSSATSAFKGQLVPATPENMQAARAFVDKLAPAGGTAIEEALAEGLKIVSEAKNLPMLLFLTDGQPTVGETDVEKLIRNAAERNAKGARIFSFGVGYDVNTKLLDALSNTNRGVREYVKPDEDIEVKVSNLYTKISNPVLSNISFAMEGVRVMDIFPKNAPDIFEGSQITILGRYTGSGEQTLRLKGTVAGKERELAYKVRWGDREEAAFLPPLWAMRKVGYLLDEIRQRGENQELVKEVTGLGKKYGISTLYTSFLVVEDESAPRRATSMRDVPTGAAAPAMKPESSETAKARQAASKGFKNDVASASAQSISENISKLAEADNMLATDAKNENSLGGIFAKKLKAEGMRTEAIQIKHIDAKTLTFNSYAWIDTEYDETKLGKPEEIAFASPEHFALAAKDATLAKILALGQNVLVVWEGKAYLIKKSEVQ